PPPAGFRRALPWSLRGVAPTTSGRDRPDTAPELVERVARELDDADGIGRRDRFARLVTDPLAILAERARRSGSRVTPRTCMLSIPDNSSVRAYHDAPEPHMQ
ncbi:hypothetical protein ACFCYL_32150, partial [Streptomyces sp. NPDC056305]|uniref:hypothetical protein n=1 Tax=Streptomyces sp. NPDC056305 TaxID=3345779 RepID=UPI0035DB0490